MLLCRDRHDCNFAAVESINEALKAGQLCIYASVLNGDSAHISEISSGIPHFSQHIEDGNLLIVDFKPFAESALQSNLKPFVELKTRIESMIKVRVGSGKSDRVLIFAEAAGDLAGNRHFDKSLDLEAWWNDVHAEWISKKMNITIICPHPASVFSAESALAARNNIAHIHTLTLELEKLRKNPHSAQVIRVLIAEPEADICRIYQKYFDKLDTISISVAESGIEALKTALSTTVEGFDLIILDTHLKDAKAIEIARQIISAIPDQRIAFTTTSSLAQIKSDIRSIRLITEEVLVKPFAFSSLLALIRAKDQPLQELS
jgi:CheY-like chemotaxis protein